MLKWLIIDVFAVEAFKYITGTAWRKIKPAIYKAKMAAAKQMIIDLGLKVEFVEIPFNLNSPVIKEQFDNLFLGNEVIDNELIKAVMIEELPLNWPEHKDRAKEIVECFLKKFELECLKSSELSSLTLGTIIARESTAIQQTVRSEQEETRKFVKELSDRNLTAIKEFQFHPQSQLIERESSIALTALEKKFEEEKNEIQSLFKQWKTKDVYVRISALANQVLDVRHVINGEIAGGIFRIFASHILRTFEVFKEANRWIEFAEEVDGQNEKTIAIRAEYLIREKKYGKARELLEEIAENSKEAFVKIVYTECLAHTENVVIAFEWLKNQDNVRDESDIKLSLAMFAVEAKSFDYAFPIIEELKNSDSPGPYPFLVSAQILMNRAFLQDEPFVFGASGDLDFLKDTNLLIHALNDIKEGIRRLSLTAKVDQEYAYPHHFLAKLHIEFNQLREAEKALMKYWQYLRKESQPWYTAATLASMKGNNIKALYRAKKGLKIGKKDDIESTLSFAAFCINIGMWNECIKVIDLIDMEDIEEEFIRAIYQLKFIAFAEKGDDEATENIINEIKDKFPESEAWLMLRVLFFLRQNKKEDALALLEKERSHFPKSIKVKLRLAALYRDFCRFNKALPLYKEIAEKLNSSNYYERICYVAFKANDAKEALSIIHRAEERGLLTEHLEHLKAVALVQDGQFDKAIDLFELFPSESLNHNDYVSYATCYANKVKPESAIEMLKEGKSKFPDDNRFYQGLYSLYLETNKPKDAFEIATEWIERSPEDKSPYFAVMTAGFAVGHQDIANATLKKYLSVFGEGPELWTSNIEEIKKYSKQYREQGEEMWQKYQDGIFPEFMLAKNSSLGIGRFRMNLLEIDSKVMAFDGRPDAQSRQLVDATISIEVLLDYYALLSIHLLELFNVIPNLYEKIYIPDVVMQELRHELSQLTTAYQRDRRLVEERVFETVNKDFTVIDKFPEIDVFKISETIGNAAFDLHICEKEKCLFVVTGFETKEYDDIKSYVDVEVITILDLLDLLKSEGIISSTDYEKATANVDHHRLKKFGKPSKQVKRVMIEEMALIILQEIEVLNLLKLLFEEVLVGPFSYALLKSMIENYKKIDEHHEVLKSLYSNINKAIENKEATIVHINIEKYDDDYQKADLDKIMSIKQFCKDKELLLWTDEIKTNLINASDGVKVTGTRSVLDRLVEEELIQSNEYVKKIVQISKWQMVFCWVTTDLLLKCSAAYNYAMSEHLMYLMSTIFNEISKFPNHVPTEIESSNFNVASKLILELWTLPEEKSQKLALGIFDEVLSTLQGKKVLLHFWIAKTIIDFAIRKKVALPEFLKLIALRLPGQVEDNLRIALILAVNGCLKGKHEAFDVAVNIIKAVKQSAPYYEATVLSNAIKVAPEIQYLI